MFKHKVIDLIKKRANDDNSASKGKISINKDIDDANQNSIVYETKNNLTIRQFVKLMNSEFNHDANNICNIKKVVPVTLIYLQEGHIDTFQTINDYNLNESLEFYRKTFTIK